VGNPFRVHWQARYLDPVVENLCFRNADALIANTDPVADMWKRRYPDHAQKVHVLWNGFDPESPIVVAPIPERPYRTLTHVGSIYGSRHPGLVVASVQRLIDSGRLNPSSIRIRLTGPCNHNSFPDFTQIERLAASGCLEFNPVQVTRKEAARLIQESDYLLLLDALGPECGLQVPGKIFDYVRIGRPLMISTIHGSAVERIARQCGIPCRVLYPDHSPEETDRLVLDFFSLPSMRTEPSDWFNENFNALAQARMLSGLISQVATS
jgi:glycosyltransferase involved in cell wall biosynthesis